MSKLAKWLLSGVLIFSLFSLPALASYRALETDGNGWASIADAPEQGLNMGLSDFMLEGWVKLNVPIASQIDYGRFFDKRGADGKGYYVQLSAHTPKRIHINLEDGVNSAYTYIASTVLDDLKWHYMNVVADRSSATGLNLYLGGNLISPISQTDLTAVGNIDTTGRFTVGADRSGSKRLDTLFDNFLIWNFGFGGLPSQVDYEAYITWRVAGRNRFLDISEYDGGAWNGYADAYQLERMTLGDLDDDNSDFESAGVDGTDIEVGTDWSKVNASAEIDNQVGSGVTTYNGSDFAVKIYTASGDYPRIELSGADLDAGFTIGDWYEIQYDYKVLNCTDAQIKIRNSAGWLGTEILTSTSWTTDRFVFQVVTDNNITVRVYSHNGTDEDGTEVVWIDNISIKRIGLVARYKFDGDVTDETSNSNDMSLGGSGSTYPGYTLKKVKILGGIK